MEGEDPEEMKTMFLEWLVVAPPHGKGSSSNVLISDGLRKMSSNWCADSYAGGIYEMPLFTLKVGKLQKLWWREVCRGNRTIVIAVYERVHKESTF